MMPISKSAEGDAPLSPEITITSGRDQLFRTAADVFAKAVADSVAQQGRFTVALSGGSTPRQLHQRIADEELTGTRRLPWPRIHVFFGDERMVPSDHADSNYRMARESLLARVPIPEANVHRVRTELGLERAIEEYEDELRKHFRLAAGEVPRFDLIFLGLGPDGHTASLFPGGNAIREQTRLATAAAGAEPPGHARVTLTLPVLNHAARVVFLVAGEDKAHIVSEVLGNASAATPYPAQLVRPEAGTLQWIIDGDAARLLPRTLDLESSAD